MVGPTVFINHMAHSGSICAMAILFQQSCIFTWAKGDSTTLRLHDIRFYWRWA